MLRVIVFICGASVMILETLGSRVIAPYFGSTSYVWTAMIGMILAALSLGYYWGGRIADRYPRIEILLYLIAGAGGLILLIPPFAPFILMGSSLIGMTVGPLIAALILFVPPGILLGTVSPFAIKLCSKGTESIGSIAGQLSALSTLGSIIGTFLTTFVFIPYLGVNNILYSMSVVLILLVLVALKGKKFYIAALLLLILIPVIDSDAIVFEKDGPYNQVVVADYNGRRWLLLNGISQGGAIKIDESGEVIDGDRYIPYQDYFHLGSLFTPEMKKGLLLGLGTGYGFETFKNNYSDFQMDIVEIDPVVIDVAKNIFNFDQRQSQVYVEDGRMFFKKTSTRYDIVIFDAYGTAAPPFHLTTKEVFAQARACLKPEGVLVVNIISSLEGEDSLMFKSILKTITSQFNHAYIFPKKHDSEELNDPTLLRNIIIVADNGDSLVNKEELLTRVQNWKGTDPVIKDNLQVFAGQYSLTREYDLEDGILLTDQYAPVERLTNHIEQVVRLSSIYRLVYLDNFFKSTDIGGDEV